MKNFLFLFLLTVTIFVQGQDTLQFKEKAGVLDENNEFSTIPYNTLTLYPDSTFLFVHDEICYIGSVGKGTYHQKGDSIWLTFPKRTVSTYSIDSLENEDNTIDFNFHVFDEDSTPLHKVKIGVWIKSKTWVYNQDSTSTIVSIKKNKLHNKEQLDHYLFRLNHLVDIYKTGFYTKRIQYLFNKKYDYEISVCLARYPDVYKNLKIGSAFPYITNRTIKGRWNHQKNEMVLDGIVYVLKN